LDCAAAVQKLKNRDIHYSGKNQTKKVVGQRLYTHTVEREYNLEEIK
jgi:hypothetical protein